MLNRILIVDEDYDPISSVLSGELCRKGYKVEKTSDGELAIDLIKREKFDVVIVGIKVINRDGFEILKFIKEERNCANPRNMRSIVLTSFADLKNALEAKRLGASDMISKPYDFDLVLEAIK